MDNYNQWWYGRPPINGYCTVPYITHVPQKCHNPSSTYEKDQSTKEYGVYTYIYIIHACAYVYVHVYVYVYIYIYVYV